MQASTLLKIAGRIRSLSPAATAEPMPYEDADGFYAAWKISDGQGLYLLKAASENELTIYRRLDNRVRALPRFYGATTYYRKNYILLEFVTGHSLMACRRAELVRVLDAMIELQGAFWDTHRRIGETARTALAGCQKRRAYLAEADLRERLDRFLAVYPTLPRTLCHNDLLPFNLIVGDERVVFIDWETGGVLPYPCMLARLLAHGSEQGETPFYMTREDKAFAIGYYYEHLLRERGISYDDYRRALELFWFFELTEWVYVYRKYRKKPDALYDHYLSQLRQDPLLP